MEENEYRKRYQEENARPCVFEKALLTRCAGCTEAQYLNLAEREGVACRSPADRTRCRAWLEVLRPQALFALKLTHLSGPLPHGREMKVQCGGLRGLRAVVTAHPGETDPVEDISALTRAAWARFGKPERIPLPEVLRHVSLFQGRRRIRPHPR